VGVNAWIVFNGSVKDGSCGLPRLLSGFQILLNCCVCIWVPGSVVYGKSITERCLQGLDAKLHQGSRATDLIYYVQ